jgi:hypothetical protein
VAAAFCGEGAGHSQRSNRMRGRDATAELGGPVVGRGFLKNVEAPSLVAVHKIIGLVFPCLCGLH